MSRGAGPSEEAGAPDETGYPAKAADHLSHGGNTRLIAAASGLPESAILDYSANINPFGPPDWLPDAIGEGLSRVAFYPDPEATEAREAAAARFSSSPDRFLFADGADSLLFALPRALAADACVLPIPTYSGYRRAIRRADIPEIDLPLLAEDDFRMDSPRFMASLRDALQRGAPGGIPEGAVARWRGADASNRTWERGGVTMDRMIVFLGSPNNPAGGVLPKKLVEDLAKEFPHRYFVIDESFLELTLKGESLIGTDITNIIVARSLTKAWAVPGARVGFIYSNPGIRGAVRAEISAWPLSSFAEAIAKRALGDKEFLGRTIPALLAEEADFSKALASMPGIGVFRSGANFLLVDFGDDSRGASIAEALLKRGIAIRRFSPDEGLSGRYARLAVRSREENRRFMEALRAAIEANKAARMRPSPKPYSGSERRL
ncbi:MAG TPA: histidinol-phosphate transaminase [Rectinemataceae bacterium]|nr:histidinol-phosphate transaminase [Rectinemataceae bacterium]